MHTPGSLLTNIKSHSMCEFSYKTCVLQFCLVQEGVGIIQAVEDGLICMHTVAADVSMTIVVAFGLLSVGISFKKFTNVYLKWLANVLLACSYCVHISHQRIYQDYFTYLFGFPQLLAVIAPLLQTTVVKS